MRQKPAGSVCGPRRGVRRSGEMPDEKASPTGVLPARPTADKPLVAPEPAGPDATSSKENEGVAVRPALARTSLYRRVPTSIRRQVDRALLLRPEACATLDAVAARFKLGERFGVTREALRTYARRLEGLVEPVIAGNLVAAILGCLPESYRRRLADGGRILLLSRVVQALTQGQAKLAPADLAKLAGLVAAVDGKTTIRPEKSKAYKPGKALAQRSRRQQPTLADARNLAEAVHMIYGLDWPAGSGSPPSSGNEPLAATGE